MSVKLKGTVKWFDTTKGLFDNVWGQIGVMITKGRLGVTIGPPADIE